MPSLPGASSQGASKRKAAKGNRGREGSRNLGTEEAGGAPSESEIRGKSGGPQPRLLLALRPLPAPRAWAVWPGGKGALPCTARTTCLWAVPAELRAVQV